jgi:hypothetical protein
MMVDTMYLLLQWKTEKNTNTQTLWIQLVYLLQTNQILLEIIQTDEAIMDDKTDEIHDEAEIL